MLIIGLTGGIGTGKSTVSETLRELGARVLNADQVGHEAYLPHQNVWQDVVDAFGEGVLKENDEIDRQKLGEIVFNDPAALNRLNGIVHPWMYRRMGQILLEWQAQKVEVSVLEAAILIEANWLPLVNQVWVTTASEEHVIRRLVAMGNLTVDQVKARIASQMPSSEREKYAQVVVDTNCPIEEVKGKVQELWEIVVEGKEL